MFTAFPSAPKLGLWLMVSLLVVMLTITLAVNAKIIADGYLSHAVNVQLKIARYKWQSGNVRGATEVLWRTTPTLMEAGWRWQVAQGYFLLAQGHRHLGDPARAADLCRAGLAILGYGRYDHTRNGTSTATRRCDPLAASP